MLFSKMNKSARLISVILYLAGDICYVISSSGFYQNLLATAGQSLPNLHERFIYAIAAYTVMAIGWYTFVLPISYAWKESKWCPWRTGILVGTSYALTVIGTFNFTLAAILPFWIGWVIWRDLLWASLWNSLMIWVYFFILPYESKHPL